MKHLLPLLVTSIIATAYCEIFIREYSECIIHPDCKHTNSVYATHLPYYDDCHKFYVCTNGRACLMECPKYDDQNRLVFNPERNVCDWPWEAPDLPNCSNQDPPGPPSSSSSSSTESTTPISTRSTTPSIITESTTLSTSTETTASSISTETTSIRPVTPPHPDPRCPRTGTKDIPHETDCNYYYHCQNGRKTLMKCYENLVFNPIIESCDQSWNYSCKTTRPVDPEDIKRE